MAKITSENFAYWLQGKLEHRDLATNPLSIQEQKDIQEHLNMVFTKASELPPGYDFPGTPMFPQPHYQPWPNWTDPKWNNPWTPPVVIC